LWTQWCGHRVDRNAQPSDASSTTGTIPNLRQALIDRSDGNDHEESAPTSEGAPSSSAGAHQFTRPSTRMKAGINNIRTSVASTSTANGAVPGAGPKVVADMSAA
jgi:hypothetical protein